MPDWSYRTVLQPLLFRLPVVTARDLCLGVMGTLGRSPLGGAVIDFMGHMRAPQGLRRTVLGITFPAPVGLGGLDPAARALGAFARFGAGFLEVGPVTLLSRVGAALIERSSERESITTPDPPDNPGVASVARALARTPTPGVPRIARLAVARETPAAQATDECRMMIEQLLPHVDAFTVPAAAVGTATVQAARRLRAPRPLLASVPADMDGDEVERLAGDALAAGAEGVAVDGAVRAGPGRREIGLPARGPALGTVSRLRECLGRRTVILAAGGVHEPEDALRLMEAGADFVVVDSGLVFSGPALPKRINEAVVFASGAGRDDAEAAAGPPTQQSWFWTLAMGAGMLLGSLMALVIAMTRVVLPYDEHFAALSRTQLAAVNDRLLAFMAHDRVTLAGTMITIGVLYVALSQFGVRRGRHWARVAVLSSALVGFASFFLFLGFGYFDPFHAFVTALLFQLFLLGAHCHMAEPHGLSPPGLRDDWRWRWSQWGQLGLVGQSIGCIVAGLVISFVGVTQVFVAEDLEFMGTTREALAAAGPQLIPLVAHDRATFGGMLVVSGMTFLMTSLWGFGHGARWLWWTILVAGLAGYVPTLAIHYAVGYHSPWHLAPAWTGFILFLGTMAISYPYLCGTDPELAEAWAARRERWAARQGRPR
jgi:dihydroorotate dehydrogenase